MLPFILFAYNTSIHSSVSKSPFYLLYGRDPVYPFDIITSPNTATYDVGENFVTELRLKKAHELAQHSQITVDKRKTYHSHTIKPYKFAVGDRVFLNQVYILPGFKCKFYSRYTGPYRIVEETSLVNFVVEDIKSKKHLLIHANRLKPATA